MTYQTIQKRHSEKWLPKIRNLRHYSLDNHFSGKPIADEQAAETLRWSIERLGDNLQIDKETGNGRLRNHSNSWFEFEVR